MAPRLDLETVAALRTEAGFDLNDLARRPGGLVEVLFGGEGVGPSLAAAWHLVGRPGTYAAFLAGLDGAAATRHRATLAAAIVEFFPEPAAGEAAAKAKAKAEPDRSGLWIERTAWELAGLCGVDGRRLSLRQLAWMARERRRFSGELASWHAATILARMPMGAVSLNPDAINPYRVPRPKSAALLALEKWQRDADLRCRVGMELKPLET